MRKVWVQVGIFSALLALGVSGCGVRSSLEAPPGAKVDKTAAAESGQGKAEGAALKPHKPFVLDGLIR